MTVSISKVHLLNVERGETEPAELWDAITEQQITDWENGWMPELHSAMNRLRHTGVEDSQWPESSHWDWRTKVEAIRGMLASSSFSIVCNGLTQGMMIVDTVSKRSRIDNQRNQHLVYVEYVENAPWNRGELFDQPRYRGVGSILIRAAISLSKELEFHGRIGLHSLPQANEFYANSCGMSNLGADPDYEGLCYFEMTTEHAQAFIDKGEK